MPLACMEHQGQLRACAEASRRWRAAAVNMAVPQQVYEMLIDEYKCLSMCAARALATPRRAAAVVRLVFV